jgi:hypothetical protein
LSNKITEETRLLASQIDERTTVVFREHAPTRPDGYKHPLYPSLAEAFRILAAEAHRDMQTAHEAAQASRIDTHKHDFLGERAAYLRVHERLLGLASELESLGRWSR